MVVVPPVILNSVLIVELDLDRVKMYQYVKYIGQKSFRLKVIVQAHTHTIDQLVYLDHNRSVKKTTRHIC